MDKRLVTFMFLAAAILFGGQALTMWLYPPPPKPPAPEQQAEQPAEPGQHEAAIEAVHRPTVVRPNDDEPPPTPPVTAQNNAAQPAEPHRLPMLGSLDERSDYRMLVTLNSRGAAVERVELNSPRYHSVDNLHPLGGYLGALHLDNDLFGCRVGVVGRGTPAQTAGLQPGDVIAAVGGKPTPERGSFVRLMRQTKPETTVKLSVLRGDQKLELDVALRRQPLCVVQPEYFDEGDLEAHDPFSFLLTLNKDGDEELAADNNGELEGLKLRDENWEVTDKDDGSDAPTDDDEVVFRRELPERKLTIVKRYKLHRVEAGKGETAAPYTLGLTVELRNTAAETRKLAYRLDGPNGLPVEGTWYARDSKIGVESGLGMRDVVYGAVVEDYVSHGMITCTTIVDKKAETLTNPIAYVGVDSQYFAAVVKPQTSAANEKWFASVAALNLRSAPALPEAQKKETNVGFRMIGATADVAPEKPLRHEFKVFLGPKVPSMLATVGAEDQIDYGWYDWLAVPMVTLLHFFYGLVRNYGLAIVMLTICVRLLLFPLSKKQAVHSIKMQALQPELKKINEKHKGQREQLAKAQQDLFRKHNLNPFAGCLPILIQLPIFVALYNSLKVDVELRQAPLISESFRWASDLSAPDMFWYWKPYLPAFLTGDGTFQLGPFLNLLPLATIALFLVQQKMFMPPPTDEQQALQQKMMKYMMIFMAVMFFKVPAGLCVYFIASSLWSIAERKVLPKPPTPAPGTATPAAKVEAAKPAEQKPAAGNGKKQKRRR